MSRKKRDPAQVAAEKHLQAAINRAWRTAFTPENMLYILDTLVKTLRQQPGTAHIANQPRFGADFCSAYRAGRDAFKRFLKSLKVEYYTDKEE